MPIRKQIKPFVTETINELQEAGYETYLVGGAVRDLLLGRDPKDFDVSTAATPEQVRAVFGRRRCMIIGRRFRIVHLRCGREIIEISTFRTEPGDQSAAKKRLHRDMPDKLIVRDNNYGSAEDDAWRRDFTVNAIFYDPAGAGIVDHTGMGVADLEAGLVRVIGDPKHRLEEDPARVLRAMKLVGQYGFRMEAQTERAVMESVADIIHCAPSRLDLEFSKVLQNPYGHEILAVFQRYGLLRLLAPFMSGKWNSPAGQNMTRILAGRNRRMAAGQYRDSLSLVLAALGLPFIEQTLNPTVDFGALWNSSAEIDRMVYDTLKSLTAPRCFPNRVVEAAKRILLLLPKLKDGEPSVRTVNSKFYRHAKELLTIVNEICHLHDHVIENLPSGSFMSVNRNGGQLHRTRRRGRKKGRGGKP